MECVRSVAGATERAAERGGALAAADDRRHARKGVELSAPIDRGHRKIQLGTLRAARQHDADWMEQRLALLAGARLHLVGRGAEALAIEPRRPREDLRERPADRARAVRQHFLTRAGRRQRASAS